MTKQMPFYRIKPYYVTINQVFEVIIQQIYFCLSYQIKFQKGLTKVCYGMMGPYSTKKGFIF